MEKMKNLHPRIIIIIKKHFKHFGSSFRPFFQLPSFVVCIPIPFQAIHVYYNKDFQRCIREILHITQKTSNIQSTTKCWEDPRQTEAHVQISTNTMLSTTALLVLNVSLTYSSYLAPFYHHIICFLSPSKS